jgi:hypothetical protein
MLDAVMTAFAFVVRAQSFTQALQWLDSAARPHDHRFSRQFAHQPVHVFELLERRPVGVPRAPVGVRGQPDGERFREVFVRMALCVPAVQVKDEALAIRLRRVIVGILHVRRPEELLPSSPLAEFVGVVNRVPRLVPEDLEAPVFRSPLDLEHHRALQFFETRMCEIERDRHAGDPIRREPFGGQPEVRLEQEPPVVDLALELLNPGLQNAPFDGQPEL